jgi:hypothetical protein
MIVTGQSKIFAESDGVSIEKYDRNSIKRKLELQKEIGLTKT